MPVGEMLNRMGPGELELWFAFFDWEHLEAEKQRQIAEAQRQH